MTLFLFRSSVVLIVIIVVILKSANGRRANIAALIRFPSGGRLSFFNFSVIRRLLLDYRLRQVLSSSSFRRLGIFSLVIQYEHPISDTSLCAIIHDFMVILNNIFSFPLLRKERLPKGTYQQAKGKGHRLNRCPLFSGLNLLFSPLKSRNASASPPPHRAPLHSASPVMTETGRRRGSDPSDP